jgi:predicted acylesterase/phospholipase RssA
MDTLVIGSGGVKGFCHLGACKELDEKIGLGGMGRIIGCSIGSMIGVLLCAGYNPKEIFREFLTINFEEMLVPGDFRTMLDRVGVFNNSNMRTLISDLVERKLGVRDYTFSEFHRLTGREFYVITTDTDHAEVRVFGTRESPAASVIDSVIASCSIPFVIQGAVIDGNFIVDGGSMDPMGLEYALQHSVGDIYCMFFAVRGFAERVARYEGIPEILAKWDEVTSGGRGSLPVEKVLGVGAKLIQCFTESLAENYVFRCIYQNKLSAYPKHVHLIPLPNFGNMLFCDSEMKVKMYFTGADVIKSIPERYLLRKHSPVDSHTSTV